MSRKHIQDYTHSSPAEAKRETLRRKRKSHGRTVIIGKPRHFEDLTDLWLSSATQKDTGWMQLPKQPFRGAVDWNPRQWMSSSAGEQIRAAVRDRDTSRVLLMAEDTCYLDVVSAMMCLPLQKVQIRMRRTAFRQATGMQPGGSAIRGGWVDLLKEPTPLWISALRRMADVLLVLLSIPVTLPLGLAVALATGLSSHGPVLHRQTCAGLHGRPFRTCMFRTTVVTTGKPQTDTIDLTRRLTAGGPEEGPQVTPLGRMLRKTGLDRLPQLLNVLRGEMSLVGPHPEEVETAALHCEEQLARLKTRPGLAAPRGTRPACTTPQKAL